MAKWPKTSRLPAHVLQIQNDLRLADTLPALSKARPRLWPLSQQTQPEPPRLLRNLREYALGEHRSRAL